MDRYVRIESATFGQTELPLPVSVRLSRHAEAKTSGGDNDLFVTSVQLAQPVIAAEVRIRGTAAAEGLSLGTKETLSFTVGPTRHGQAARTITLSGAVLQAVELTYEQAAIAVATLRFVAEADTGTTDPFSAEDSQ